ncbi:MAG: PAS domain-containing protein [Ancalomicrobiaceae bacterium]|nr:PAS domain-containing protein [Ancalomicrobiaceae bacterium]
MKHQATRDLYSYWQSLRRRRPAPDRSEIEPADIRHLLGHTFILEVVSATEYRYRLAGTRLCAIYGREMKGKDFNSFWAPKDRDAVLTMLSAICEDAAATVVGVEGLSDHGRKLPMECLLLPLRQSGEGFTRILGSMVPMDDPYWIGVHPVMTQTVSSLRLIWPDEPSAGLIHSSALDTDVGLYQKSTPQPLPFRRRVNHLTVYDGGKE